MGLRHHEDVTNRGRLKRLDDERVAVIDEDWAGPGVLAEGARIMGQSRLLADRSEDVLALVTCAAQATEALRAVW